MNKHRTLIQTLSALVFNSNIPGFFQGRLYTGPTKAICVPILNCYSCPGALGACPIGSLQAVMGSRDHSFSFYVSGMIMLFGLVFGRLICGFLCPFGFIQDLLYKIKAKKAELPTAVDRVLRYLKYFILAVPVILLPVFAVNQYGIAPPWFCQWICPAGTLEAAIPLLLKNAGLRNMMGNLFSVKAAILGVVIVVSVLIYRPFCKYLCPLGAAYSFFNRFSLYQMNVDRLKCINCGACERACKMRVAVRQNINHAECIRCGACRNACEVDAISCGFTVSLPQKPAPEKVK